MMRSAEGGMNGRGTVRPATTSEPRARCCAAKAPYVTLYTIGYMVFPIGVCFLCAAPASSVDFEKGGCVPKSFECCDPKSTVVSAHTNP